MPWSYHEEPTQLRAWLRQPGAGLNLPPRSGIINGTPRLKVDHRPLQEITMRDPTTLQETVALDLATNRALADGLRGGEMIRWACEHWPEFLEEASDPELQAAFQAEGDRVCEEMEAFQALSNLLVGPPPPNDASEDEQIAWGEHVDAEMRRLERRLDGQDLNLDGCPDHRDVQP